MENGNGELEKKVEELALLLRQMQEEQRKGIAELRGQIEGMIRLLTPRK